jgi:protein-tyrosine phosphatase
MKSIPSILFVCMGNICRSPSAEIIWKSKLEDIVDEDSFVCDSAGTIAYHVGEPPDARMQQALRKSGYQPFGKARKLSLSDFERFDLILVMDEANLESVLGMFANRPEVKDKIHLFCDYAGIEETREVPDPYYGGVQGFDKVIELLENGCDKLILKFKIGKNT